VFIGIELNGGVVILVGLCFINRLLFLVILVGYLGSNNVLNAAEQFRQMIAEFKKDGINDNDLEMIFGGSASEILGLS
jgi:hypothetical protein